MKTIKSNSILDRILFLEKELGIIQESFNSKSEVEEYLIQKSVPAKIKELEINPQRFVDSGRDLLKYLDLDDPRFIDHDGFYDIQGVLGSFVYSGFCCDFTSGKLNVRELRNKKFVHTPWDEYGVFYLTSVDKKQFNSIEQFLKLNFDSINVLNFLEKYVDGEVALKKRSIVINGDLDLSGKLGNFKSIKDFLKSLKIKEISKVTGNVDFSDNNLESLYGMPYEIYGDLDISNNRISGFRYCDKQLENVGGKFIFNNNPIDDWEFLPVKFINNLELKLTFLFKCKRVELDGDLINAFGNVYLSGKLGSYKSVHDYLKSEFGLEGFGTISHQINISSNNLESLYGCPKKCLSINASNNNLRNLEYCPEVGVHGTLEFYSNSLISLEGIKDDIIWDFDVMDNKLKSLDFIPKKINYMANVMKNPGLNGRGFTEDYVLSKTECKDIRF